MHDLELWGKKPLSTFRSSSVKLLPCRMQKSKSVFWSETRMLSDFNAVRSAASHASQQSRPACPSAHAASTQQGTIARHTPQAKRARPTDTTSLATLQATWSAIHACFESLHCLPQISTRVQWRWMARGLVPAPTCGLPKHSWGSGWADFSCAYDAARTRANLNSR